MTQGTYREQLVKIAAALIESGYLNTHNADELAAEARKVADALNKVANSYNQA